MDRYCSYSRDLRPIEGLSSLSDIPPLRDYPLKCDPRRERSYKKVQDIERSREDRPLVDLPTDPYRVRRIVVPRTRLQPALPSRVPNARDPRGVQACRRGPARRSLEQKWEPTLVESDGVPREEETCAVLVVDASEWESRGVKSCYIDVIPHECNVQRALCEAEVKLAQIDDGLLMSAEEAEKRMEARAPQLDDSDAGSSSGTVELTDSDVQECDSEGEVVPGRARREQASASGFETVEDRPMLEVGDGPDVSAVSGGVSSPRPIDEDEDEDRVIYDEEEEPQVPPMPKPDDADVECVELDADEVVVPKKEPEAPPEPRADDADVMCIDLDDDDDEVIVPKQEPQPPPVPKPNDADIQCIDLELDVLDLDNSNVKQEPQDAFAPYAKNVQREVLGVVTLDDSDEFDEDYLNSLDDLSIPRERHENDKPESGDDWSVTCSNVTFYGPPDTTKDLLDNPSVVPTGEKNGEGQDHGESVSEQNSTPSDEKVESRRKSDCDSASAVGSDLVLDSVIIPFHASENNSDAEAREQSAASVGFGAATPETSDIADKAGRSGDGDSDEPTVTRVETVAEVHVPPATSDHEDDHSEICDSSAENEKAPAQLANSPTKARKRRRKKRKRLDTGNAGAPIAETKRRKENDDDDEVAVNDENKNENVIERVPSPVFQKLSKKRKRPRWQSSDNVLQLSTVSTRAISKPSTNVRRTISISSIYALGNFFAIGDLQDYLKNYTATYNSIEFFCKNFQKISVFEFLRVNEYVKNNIAFWQNRNNHWQQKDNNASIEDVTDNRSSNQLLAITDSPSVCGNNKVPYSHEVIQPGEQEAVKASTSAEWNQQSISIEEDMTNCTKSSWYAQESNMKDVDGKAKLQRRHSLPMVMVPQQNLGAKRPRSGSEDNPIKLTLRRSQINDCSWIATHGTSTLQNITAQCTLSISNNHVQTENVQGETITDKDVIPTSQSLKVSKLCTLNKKRLPTWSCIDKEVPELYIDDLANRPLPKKINFDESKLSFTLQCRVKRRSTSIDSAIASDFDDCTSKRRKLTDSTKEYDSSMDNIFNECNDRLAFNNYTRESLEITELSPDSCIESSRPSSVNICNLNNNTNESTCETLGNWKSCNLEDLPKNCPTSAVDSNQECLNLDGSDTPCLENDNASSSSDSSFHLCVEDEPEEPKSTVESCDLNIQIDYNCNLQKDLNSLDNPCERISNINQEERNSIVHSEKQNKFSNSKAFTRDVNKLNKKLELLFGESDIDEAKRLVAAKSNCNIHQIVETAHVQTNIQTENPIESRLQSIEEEQSIGNPEEETCATKSQALDLNFTDSGSVGMIINNERQEYQTSNDEESNIDTNLDRSTHLGNHLSNYEELTPIIICSEKQDKIIINGVLIIPDVQNDSPKNVDQDEVSLDVPSSQALIINEEQNQVESENILEDETSLPIGKQSSVIVNEEVGSDVPHCNITINTSEQVFQNQNDEDKDDPVSEDEKNQEKDGDLLGNQKTNNIYTSSLLLYQDQVLPETDDVEHSLGDTLNVANDMNPEHSPSEGESRRKQQDRDQNLLENQERSNINASSQMVHQDQVLPENDDQHSLGDTIGVATDKNPEHSPSKGKSVLQHEEERDRDQNLLGNQETSNMSTLSPLLHQDQVLPQTVNLEEGLEEGDFEFLPTIQRIKSNIESDDEYDIDSDCDEYDNQTTVNYLIDVNVQNVNESLIYNENTAVRNCETNCERDYQSPRIEDKQESPVSEDENHSSLHNSASNIRIFDAATSNSTNVDQEDDDIIIEYENISDCSFPKDIKPDISNVNHDSNIQVGDLPDLHVSNLDIHEDRSLNCQSEVQKIVTPTPLPGSSLHEKVFAIAQDELQTHTTAENINSLDQSRVEIPVPDANLVLPMTNTSPISAMEASVSNGISDKILDASTSVSPPLTPELIIQPTKNISVDLNNPNILQKFNLTKEVIAPEDTHTENSITFENNDEEQILSDTLKIFANEISEDHSEEDYKISTITDEQNYSNKDVEVPAVPITIEFKLPTNKAQSGNGYDLLKALNVNVDNEVDIITPEIMDKNSSKQASSGIIKVKNLKDMLEKPPTATKENVPSNGNVSPNQNVSINQDVSPNQDVPSNQNVSCNLLPDVAHSNQQSISHGIENLQSQPNVPVNVFPTNNALPNAYVIQTVPYTYVVNQSRSGGPLQPIMNMCNIVPVPVPITNNIGQPAPATNTSSLNQAPVQVNPPIPPPAAPSSDKQIVLASSMFPDMFDSHATSSFCSKTVFNLQLPPLPNIILPPPYTILPTYDQATISQKIESYKWELLEKLISTLTELENININIIKRNLEILFYTQTLTEETWHFQERLLIVAQCVGSLQKLTTDKNYSNIIEAIMGSIYTRIRDRNLLKKLFGIFLKLKERGIFKSFAAEQQPLALELGIRLNQSAIGMSSGQKEVLKYQVKIYQEIFKINSSSLQSNRVSPFSNQTKTQAAVQRSSPMAIQQNVVTTTVSSPVTETTNSSFQDLVMQEQSGGEKINLNNKINFPIQQGSRDLANKCDNISISCIKCGKKSQILCSRCKIATYCSQNCQMEHWKIEHNASCNSVKT